MRPPTSPPDAEVIARPDLGTPRSLAFSGGHLHDPLTDLVRVRPHLEDLASTFDAVSTSPCGHYQVFTETFGERALLTCDGQPWRALTRSPLHARTVAYPVALGTLEDGRTLIAHCPDSPEVLEFEDALSGHLLSARPPFSVTGEPLSLGVFHSRLAFGPAATHLLSAGWCWHPVQVDLVFQVQQALGDPTHLDDVGLDLAEETLAAQGDAGSVPEPQDSCLWNGQLIQAGLSEEGHTHLTSRRILPGHTLPADAPGPADALDWTRSLADAPGALFPLGRFILGAAPHPRLFCALSGATLLEWPDLPTHALSGCFVRPPVLAVHAAETDLRFAAVSAGRVWEVRLNPHHLN